MPGGGLEALSMAALATGGPHGQAAIHHPSKYPHRYLTHPSNPFHRASVLPAWLMHPLSAAVNLEVSWAKHRHACAAFLHRSCRAPANDGFMGTVGG